MARVPIIHQSAAEQMTANVLKRIDPDIEELLASAGHVALYNFDIPTKRWSRKDVEGSLFLVRRQSHPRFQLIILNKKSAGKPSLLLPAYFRCRHDPLPA
jgi:hypothetical protein